MGAILLTAFWKCEVYLVLLITFAIAPFKVFVIIQSGCAPVRRSILVGTLVVGLVLVDKREHAELLLRITAIDLNLVNKSRVTVCWIQKCTKLECILLLLGAGSSGRPRSLSQMYGSFLKQFDVTYHWPISLAVNIQLWIINRDFRWSTLKEDFYQWLHSCRGPCQLLVACPAMTRRV